MRRAYLAVAAAATVAALLPGAAAHADTSTLKGYLVALTDSQPASPGFQMTEANRQAALAVIRQSGGTVVNDMSKTIGIVQATSVVAGFGSTLEASALVDAVAQDVGFKAMPSYEEALVGGLTTLSHPGYNDAPEPSADPMESQQWNMQMIRTEAAHAKQAGIRAVEVGILDSGIDGRHADFSDTGIPGGPSNVNCLKGRDSVATVEGSVELFPEPVVKPTPGVGVSPDPCVDNQFHGTHVAGIVAAQANGVGMVGVAPNVELIPVKVCDTAGYCYVSAVLDGINYAAKMRFEAINMSFFVDDNNTLSSTEFKCASDPVQRDFRHMVERAIQYARQQGVTPVAALGNSAQDLAHPVGEDGQPVANECEVVPAETQGVIGVSALNTGSTLSSYSNYGAGMNDVSAPGGSGTTGNCRTNVPSTFPANAYGCISGTSMASPHAAGVAALIISQYGTPSTYDHDSNPTTPPLPDWEMRPQQVENYMQSTTIDIGLPGYDECYGNGRIDAVKAVNHDTARVYEPKTCQWYAVQP